MNMSAWKQLPIIPNNPNHSRDSYYEDHRSRSSKGFNDVTTDSGNFKVVIRVRPPLEREMTPYVPFQSAVS